MNPPKKIYTKKGKTRRYYFNNPKYCTGQKRADHLGLGMVSRLNLLSKKLSIILTILLCVIIASLFVVVSHTRVVEATSPCFANECWPGSDSEDTPYSAAFPPSSNPIERNQQTKPFAPPCNPGVTVCAGEPWLGLPGGTAAGLGEMKYPNMGPSVASMAQPGGGLPNPFEGIKSSNGNDSLEDKIRRMFNPLASGSLEGNDPPNIIVTGASVPAVRAILHRAGMQNNVTNTGHMLIPDDEGNVTNVCNMGSDATTDFFTGIAGGFVNRGGIRDHARYWPMTWFGNPATVIAASNESTAIGYSGSGHSLVDYDNAQDEILNKLVENAAGAGYGVSGIYSHYIPQEGNGHSNSQVGPYQGGFSASPFGYEVKLYKK